MKTLSFNNFEEPINQAGHLLRYRSLKVHSQTWQGIDISKKPEMATREVTHMTFSVNMSSRPQANLDDYRRDIRPNLPWADNHFLERVCGDPINPGVEWANWPWSNSAGNFLDKSGQFNHNYMERYWPRWAGMESRATGVSEEYKPFEGLGPNKGIRYEYGDLMDVVYLLARDPYTRQAYLPVWFPEDTGGKTVEHPAL